MTKHGPDYSFTYIERVVQAMHLRGMVITPQDILTALWKLSIANIPDDDAETMLYYFLERFSPAGMTPDELNDWDGKHLMFDWTKVDTSGTAEEAAMRYGLSNARLLLVMRS